MKRTLIITTWILTLLLSGFGNALNGQTSEETVRTPLPNFALINGNWFDGKTFKKATFYSVKGIITGKKPNKIDRTIDLDNSYIIPPFGEAHNHNLDQPRRIKEQIRMYLLEGVFYSKNQNNVRLQTVNVLDQLNQRASVDVAYANGGLAATDGHVVELYEKFFRRGFYRRSFPKWKKEDLDTKAFFIINDEEDLKNKWKLVLEGKPDFIKTFLEYSEEYEKRKDDPKYYGKKGLNPSVLRLIVEKAHKAGLRVSTHIETAADFRNALLAGVDEIVHMPGYNIPEQMDISRFQIAAEDAKLARKKGVTVVTTTYLSNNLLEDNPTQLSLVRSNYTRNLKLLHDVGVKLAIGSDSYSVTSLAEAMNLHELKVFDNLSLLKYWTEVTPQTIFPKRKIGLLQEGYEASFIGLEGNPLTDFKNVRRIVWRFKQGSPLDLVPTEEEKFINRIFTDGVDEALRVYEKSRKKNPGAYKFTERALNDVGYKLISERELKDAIKIFQLIVNVYPQSANAFDSLGEAYMLSGNRQKAIENYCRSLELDPKNENAREQLKKLGAGTR